MLLEYEWGNPASAAAAMLLFGDDQSGQDACQERQLPVFDPHYVHSLGMDFFQQPQPISPAALFSAAGGGMMLPPPAPARIGLNLGVRTYFSSVSLEEEEIMARRARRRRTRTARCQAEGCGADLTHAKHYHRRHKVCEFHSKASVVVAAGLSQRFCQQCSRFHVLSEFDQGKRSCRKRLADHNRRRRKSQDLNAPSMAVAKDDNNTTDDTTITTANNNNNKSSDLDSALIASLCKQETSPMVTHITTSPPLTPSLVVRPMALGLGDGAIPMMTVSSASSSTANTRPQTASYVSHLGDFHGHEHPFSSWSDREDGSSIGMYQNK